MRSDVDSAPAHTVELGINQNAVSGLEHRSDLLLSTLRRTVEAMGGRLSLIARFSDRPRSSLRASPMHDSRES